MIGIYSIICNINNKRYIGQSVDISTRMHQHKYESFTSHTERKAYNSIIHRAIRKYGWENFSFIVLEECSVDKLDERERYYIKKYNTIQPNGYNIMAGGQKYRRASKHNTPKGKDRCPICQRRLKTKKADCCEVCFLEKNQQDNRRFSNITGEELTFDIELISHILDTSLTCVAEEFGYTASNGLIKRLKSKQMPYKIKDMLLFYRSYYGYPHIREIKKIVQDNCIKKSPKFIGQFDKNGNLLDSFYYTKAELQKRNFISSRISECCIGKHKTYKGYVFKYL